MMSYTFNDAKVAFSNDKIRDLSEELTGRRFLLLRSLSRSASMRKLAENCNIDVSQVAARDLLCHLYENKRVTQADIEATIGQIYTDERNERKQAEAELISELYRLQSFDWGGLHQNSLEKTIVDNYVKKITNYDALCDNIENRLYPSMRAYVLCSWYNHWTSIIIEDIFKDHPAVLPAVGLIKKVDFFINGTPFDLKVTYLPEGFIKDKRKGANLRPELTLLRQFARAQKINFNNSLPDARLLEDLWNKVADHPENDAVSLIEMLKNFRDALVDECLDSPRELIKWLYENQGVRRFDASNRFFLILIKKGDYFNSWKLKRAKDLLVSEIQSNLDSFDPSQIELTDFEWEGSLHQALAATIFVVRD